MQDVKDMACFHQETHGVLRNCYNYNALNTSGVIFLQFSDLYVMVGIQNNSEHNVAIQYYSLGILLEVITPLLNYHR